MYHVKIKKRRQAKKERGRTRKLGIKNGQAPFIAPLQPFTLAAFPPWGI